MTTKFYVEEFEANASDDEDEDDPAWDALDWCYLVKKEGDEIVCICATKQEADHIAALLLKEPLP